MIGYRVVVMGKQYETKRDKNEKKKQMKKRVKTQKDSFQKQHQSNEFKSLEIHLKTVSITSVIIKLPKR